MPQLDDSLLSAFSRDKWRNELCTRRVQTFGEFVALP